MAEKVLSIFIDESGDFGTGLFLIRLTDASSTMITDSMSLQRSSLRFLQFCCPLWNSEKSVRLITVCFR